MVLSLFKKKKKEEEFYGDLDNLKDQLGGIGGMSEDMSNNYGMSEPGQNLYDYNTNPGSFSAFENQNQQPVFGTQGFGTQQVQSTLQETKPLLKEKIKEKTHKQHLKEEKPLEVRKELLIKVEDYKKVRELLQQLKEKMSEVERIVNELKEDENKRIESIKGLKEKLEESKSNINSVLDIFR